MANLVIASNSKKVHKLDKSVRDKVWPFIEKLSQDHTAPGLHIEHIQSAVDPKVRTGRVDLKYRAVLFKVDDKLGGEPTFVYMGTWPHDEAIAIARGSQLRVNPVNGVLEGILGDAEAPAPANAVGGAPAPGPATPEPAAPAATYLAGAFGLADLTERLGLDEDLARRALGAPDEDAYLTIADNAVGWQSSALLELATGTHIDEIRDKHGFTDSPVDDTLDEDQQILKALEQPASKMQFTFVDDDAELRRVIEGGDFGAWRTFLHPEQRKYVDHDYNGAFRLSGGAGTGKTVVAIHRARRLALTNPAARVVLTTYNKTLAADMKSALVSLDPDVPLAAHPGEPGVYVGGIDALGNAVLNQTGDIASAAEKVLGSRGTELTRARTNADKLWRDVVVSVDSGLDPRLTTPGFLEKEYVAVVLANRVTSLQQYAKVPRAGRGVRLSRPQRIAVWKLIEAFRRQSRIDGTLSFPEVLALAAEQLRLRAEAGQGHLADHVLVDEAQDLHATHWALLRNLVAEGSNDLFIAEDSHQRIYGQPVVLSRFGIKIVGRSRRLTLNYRTTAQNLHFAVSILSGAEYADLEQGEESTAEYRSARLGPDPRLLECDSPADELDRVAELVKSWIAEGVEPSTIAVLTRGHNDRSQFVRALGERGVDARALDNAPASPGHVQVLTMHRSKGMEFSRVILAGVDNAHVPSSASLKTVPAEELDEAMLRERSLLYVAASRARDALVVTWSGTRSELLGGADL